MALQLKFLNIDKSVEYIFEKNPILPANIKGKITKKTKIIELKETGKKIYINKKRFIEWEFDFKAMSDDQDNEFRDYVNKDEDGDEIHFYYNTGSGWQDQGEIKFLGDYDSKLDKSGIRYSVKLKFRKVQPE